MFCSLCSVFVTANHIQKHEGHNIITGISDHQMTHPTEFLIPLSDEKKEAQYLFSKSTTITLVDIFKKLNFRNIICMGAPRIHEYIVNNEPDMSSVLLDFDKRLHSFFGPLNFCWYNSFNNHFFLPEAENVFENFLTNDGGKNFALIMDPPFGGRTEPLINTINQIEKKYQKTNKIDNTLPIFWIFPYFMEPQIVNSLPNFSMLDYRVDYDNHALFQSGKKGRKNGSPVRIFTNVPPGGITLPAEEGYRYCKPCDRWVSISNRHCSICEICPSKDGQIYRHCSLCKKCVKPNWQHCEGCGRCALPEHDCQMIPFSGKCLICKQFGHKKVDCPKGSKKRKIFAGESILCKNFKSKKRNK